MTNDRLDSWRATGAISANQHATLVAIVRRDLFTVFLELNALLYLGVVAFAAGLGWTIYENFAALGDAAVVAPLAGLLAGCLYYCFSRARPFSTERVESPSFAFDYVLYLACLVFAVAIGYIELRFKLLKANWDYDLLVSATVYLALAYRFDNRFVLSLGLSTLGAWFGVRLSALDFHLGGSSRGDALAYAAMAAAGGLWTHRLRVKAHFLETFLHVAANAGLGAITSGVINGDNRGLWLVALLAAGGVSIERGLRARRFAFVAYGVLYGYVGVSARLLERTYNFTAILTYFLFSAAAVIVSLVVMARRIGREA